MIILTRPSGGTGSPPLTKRDLGDFNRAGPTHNPHSKPDMNLLFEPFSIKNLTLPNRFVRSATYDGMAEKNGRVSSGQIRMVEELARGGVGLIILGIAYVHPSGQISPVQNSLADDECIPGFRTLAETAHEHGAKIAVQLFHAGRETAKVFKPHRKQALAPSSIPDDPNFQGAHRAMTEEEILEVIRAFGQAAGRAKEAGLDAVQVHGAHAYLLSQFLSPFTNRRTDAWGGDLENRLRLHREILRAIRSQVGEDYPVLIKIGVQDGFPGGLEFNEGKAGGSTPGPMGLRLFGDQLRFKRSGLRQRRIQDPHQPAGPRSLLPDPGAGK